jgi:hypothetical protein
MTMKTLSLVPSEATEAEAIEAWLSFSSLKDCDLSWTAATIHWCDQEDGVVKVNNQSIYFHQWSLVPGLDPRDLKTGTSVLVQIVRDTTFTQVSQLKLALKTLRA